MSKADVQATIQNIEELQRKMLKLSAQNMAEIAKLKAQLGGWSSASDKAISQCAIIAEMNDGSLQHASTKTVESLKVTADALAEFEALENGGAE